LSPGIACGFHYEVLETHKQPIEGSYAQYDPAEEVDGRNVVSAGFYTSKR
jgi:hypothetical protein